ncbi:FAD-dependent oxidoreductase [Acidianus sp. HS-5]|uniref:NAD(P)/FAD-dependent oxidoreductase n=1 Tax=Acidianus sp. HS-5 TaxID=2886040 RepID=UPI001F3D0B46|nr:FAD-dependent oxidoreductase [Acidianus sp. HS-5]BDC17203.1 FAD-dependent oxidoreductase [Acidianus sp. HS-5]
MIVVILGGGFAGLSALKTHDAVLVDNKDYFILAHKLVDVVRTGDPSIAKIPYHKVFKAAVKSIDFRRKIVITSEGEIPYDKLIISLGYSQKFIEGTEKFENIDDALRIREKLLKAKTVVIIGGGNLGVELSSLAREMGKEVYLIEGQKRLLNFMSWESSAYAEKKLKEMGVNLLLNTKVEKIEDSTVYTEDQKIKGDLIVSSIGFKGPSLLKELGLSTINDRMVVDDYLSSVDQEDVYGAGDCSTTKKFVPMSAQVAVQAGRNAMLNALGFERKFSYRQYAIIVRVGEEYFGDLLGKFVKGKVAELAENLGIYRARKLLSIQ